MQVAEFQNYECKVVLADDISFKDTQLKATEYEAEIAQSIAKSDFSSLYLLPQEMLQEAFKLIESRQCDLVSVSSQAGERISLTSTG